MTTAISDRYAITGDGCLWFGGKPSGPSEQDKRNARLQEQLLKKQLAEKPPEIAMPAIEMPKPQVFAPPPQQTSQDTEAAAREMKQAMRRKRGILRSRLGAGDTGGAMKKLSGSAKL